MAATLVSLLTRLAAPGRAHLVAVRDADRELPYGDLVRESSAVAGRLAGLGVGPDDVVGIRAPHGAGLVVAMLGVLSAGAAYVVVPPTDPPARQAALLRRCSVRVTLDGTGQAAQPAGPARSAPEPALAYVCFTSGSTGEPKGVAVSRAALAHYVEFATNHYDLPALAGQVSLFHTSAAHDLHVTSVLPALVSGMVVEVTTAGDPAALAERLAAGAVGLLKMTPSHVRWLAASGAPAPRARVIVVGGEPFGTTDAGYLLGASPRPRVFNEYGPTEATVGCAAYECTAGDPAGDLPIGPPAPGMSQYVRAADLAPAGDGHGELFVAGAGLARGYLGSPALTAERFVPDPFGPAGSRMYRTGDRVTGTEPDGLRCAGRVDEQLSVSGHRVEPREIRARLLRHDACRDAVVYVRGDTLCAAVVAHEVTAEDLRDALARVLPAYLVPARIDVVEALPLTENGKLDHHALKRLAAVPTDTDPLRQDLRALFGDLLEAPVVDDNASFLSLGGSSIRAIQLITRIEATFGLRLSPPQLYSADPDTGIPHASVNGVHRMLSGDHPPTAGTCVRVREGTGGGTVVLAHGAGGDLGAYRQLTGSLAGDLRVIVLQALRSAPVDHRDLAALARFHADRLHHELDGAPAGPVHLAGWSFGGLLALELAAHLTGRGVRVDSLTVVDSFLDGAEVSRDVVQAHAVERGLPLDRHLAHSLDLYEDHLVAARHHKPSEVAVPITVVHATDHSAGRLSESRQAWSARTTAAVRHVDLAGDHYSVLANPALADVIGR